MLLRLAVTIRTGMSAEDVLETLYSLLLRHGTADTSVQTTGRSSSPRRCRTGWLGSASSRSASIQDHPSRRCLHRLPGSAWENGYNERFNGTLHREALNAEWFTTTKQPQIVINHWLRQYNHTRPHQTLSMRPPVPETLLGKHQTSCPETKGLDTWPSYVSRASPRPHDAVPSRRPCPASVRDILWPSDRRPSSRAGRFAPLQFLGRERTIFDRL